MHDYGMQNVQWTRPAIDLQRFATDLDSTELRTKLGIEKDEIAVLFVGNAKRQKNMHGVLHAFHLLRKNVPG